MATKRKAPKRKRMARPLTPKQEHFVRAWMVRRNNTLAYLDAFPDAGRGTANCEGSKLYNRPDVRAEIDRLLDEEAARLKHSGRKVTEQLAAIAFGAISDLFDQDGKLIEPHLLPRDVAAAVKRYKPTRYGMEVEMADKLQALRLLGLDVGLFAEKVEHSGDDALLEALRLGRERALAGP